MNSNQKFWSDQKDEALKKFGADIEKVKDLSLDLTKTVITVHATFLGLTLSLMGYLQKAPNFYLLLTWASEILAISFGLLSFKQYIDSTAANSVNTFQFSFDMGDINQREAGGQFIGKEADRTGLLLAALIRRSHDAERFFSKEQREIAKTYAHKLPTAKMFVLNENNSVLNKLTPGHSLVSQLFYGFTLLAFIFLVFSVIV